MNQPSNDYIEQALLLAKKNNKLVRKRNRLAKKQQRQSELNYQQSERLYLLEKSKMQPRFRLTVGEFLLNKPDFVNDPEQAGEAKFLVDNGLNIDQRVVRIKLEVKQEAPFMRPSMVVATNTGNDNHDEQILSMTSRIFFVALDSIEFDSAASDATEHCFNLYLLYYDQTTLPVALKFKVTQQHDSRLLRWEVEHIDTAFALSRHQQNTLCIAKNCEQLFV